MVTLLSGETLDVATARVRRYSPTARALVERKTIFGRGVEVGRAEEYSPSNPRNCRVYFLITADGLPHTGKVVYMRGSY